MAASSVDMFKAFKSLRSSLDYPEAIGKMTGRSYDHDKAAAILIYLTVSKLGRTDASNIVLASWALLEGYNTDNLRIDRGHLGRRRNKLKADIDLNGNPSNFDKKEEALYSRISDFYGSEFKDEGRIDAVLNAALESEYYDNEAKRVIIPKLFRESQLPVSESTNEDIPLTPESSESSQSSDEEGSSPEVSAPLVPDTRLLSEDTEPPQPPKSKKWLIPAFAGLAVLLAVILLIAHGKRTNASSVTPTSESISYNLSYADGDDEGEHWGDSNGGRQVYTNSEVNSGALGDSIVFNSIADGEFGDERNFVGAALVGDQESVWYGNQIEVKDGETYVICIYLHNDNPDGLKAIAEDARASFFMPYTVGKLNTIIGYIDSSNAEPSRYMDAVTLQSSEDVYLTYIAGSARYCNNGMGDIPLSDDIIMHGVPVGYDRFDGKVPGGYGYDGIVTIQVNARTSVTTKLSTQARLKGTSQWSEAVYANNGDEIEFQIEYENMTAESAKNVMIRDILPDNMEYIKGSTVLYNYTYQNGLKVDQDTLTTTGINIGNYGARGNAYVRFSAKVVNENLANGANQLVNWSSATVNGEVVSIDDSTVMVTK